MPNFSSYIRSVLFGSPFGESFPPRVEPQPGPVDGRTHCLRILRRYISELTMYRQPAKGQPPIPFQIPEKNIHIESFPDYVEDLVFPSIVFLPGKAEYAPIGLTAYIEEDTLDRYAPGTVVMWMSEYTETFQLEIWASKRPERRGILSALEEALSPTEQSYGLIFHVPDYFDEFVCYTVMDRILEDDTESSKNRRRARMSIEMRYNVVRLVNAQSMKPELAVNVLEPTEDVDDFGKTLEFEVEP